MVILVPGETGENPSHFRFRRGPFSSCLLFGLLATLFCQIKGLFRRFRRFLRFSTGKFCRSKIGKKRARVGFSFFLRFPFPCAPAQVL